VFKVKICGVRSISDARIVAKAGGDGVGFNFYPKSARYVDPIAAKAIARELPPTVWKVGVFVNEPGASMAETCRRVGLDCVQLHGDEAAALLAELPESVAVVRAFRVGEEGLGAAAAFLRACECSGRLPDAVLVDAQVPGALGGTGRTVDWHALVEHKDVLGQVPLILAGGLTPENVRQACEVVRPSGVDTASGVEVSPGVKDPQKVRRFIREAMDALGRANAAT
jgi:phosphoribosylanthranilate isomerase